jgi:heme exporter protein C
MGNLYRLVYIHPATAFVALYLAFGLATVASLLYLWPRTRSLFWDRLAATSVEVGMVFIFLTCVSGSIWGRPTWGVWWAWDPLLTATAILLVLYLGYLALRRVPAEPEVRAKRCAISAIISALDIPIIHFSVYWWNTLHQGPTVLNAGLSPRIYGSMAWTMLLSFVALALVFVWMLLMRYRIGVLQDYLGDGEMTVALYERMAEGATPDASLVVRPATSAPPAPPVPLPQANPTAEALTAVGAGEPSNPTGTGASSPP